MITSAISCVAKIILHEQWKPIEAELGLAYRDYSSLVKPQMSKKLIEVLIIGEDHRFYQHGGVDFISILRAIWKFIFKNTIEGGSTIEQQLIRTITGKYERCLSRKAKEILFATMVCKVIPKSDIPGVYLSLAYFGWRKCGIIRACKLCNTEPNAVSSLQAAQIIARLKYPEPKTVSSIRTKQINRRAQYILKLLERNTSAFNSSRTEIVESI